MGGILWRIVAAASWLLSRERLAEIPGDAGSGRQRSRGFWGWISGGSELTDAPVAGGSGVTSRRFWSWIVSGEEIPTLSEALPRGVPSIHRFWAAIFAGGDLNDAEIQGTGRAPTPGAGVLRWVLSPEVCPEEPAPSRPPSADRSGRPLPPEAGPTDLGSALHGGGGFVRWLLSVEECPVDRRPVVPSGRTFWQWLASSERL